jgi:hypothetical protein
VRKNSTAVTAIPLSAVAFADITGCVCSDEGRGVVACAKVVGGEGVVGAFAFSTDVAHGSGLPDDACSASVFRVVERVVQALTFVAA